MKVFRVRCDVNKYQSLLPVDEGIWQTQRLIFDGRPMAEGWVAPQVYVLQPRLKRGNFLKLSAGCFVCDRMAYDGVRELLEESGEQLPLTFEGHEFYVQNVTQWINALDEIATQWVVGDAGARIHIKRYAFHRNRLPDASLFKIPFNGKGEVLTYEGLKDPEDEFKPTVERLGLTGLVFDEVWSE